MTSAPPPRDTRIVAIGLLTADQVALLGDGLRRSWPIDHAPRFVELLHAIDEADARHRCEPGSELSVRDD